MIKNYHYLLLIGLFISACTTGNNKEGQKPTWVENFDEKDLDTTVWSRIQKDAYSLRDWNRYMSDYDSCYAIRNGKLILRGIKNDGLTADTRKYLTSGVYTRGKKSFGLGRLEIRAKLGDAKGAWPAFWMLGEDVKYPNGGEIDIMERLNGDSIVHQTAHSYYTIKLGIKDNPPQKITASIKHGQFNTYAVETYPDSLVFYVNERRTFAYPRIETDKKGQFPFSQYKHYLLLDMQLGGSWVREVDSDDLPVEMEIDWVKFYEFEKGK